MAVLRRPDCFKVSLKNNLMRGLIKGLTGKPGAMSPGPVLADLVRATVTQ